MLNFFILSVLIVKYVQAIDSSDDRPKIRGSIVQNKIDKEINVIVKADTQEGKSLATSKATKIRSTIDRLGIMSITTSYKDMIYLRNHASIERVEIDHKVTTTSAFGEKNVNDRHIQERNETIPWGIMEVLQDVKFWNRIEPPSGLVKLCIADTGYDLEYEDLPTDEIDVVGSSNLSITEVEWYHNGNGHGTHIAEIIAVLRGNSRGSVGMFPNDMGTSFQLEIGKATNRSGVAYMSDLMNAVESCYQNQADVISMSLGGSSSSDIVRELFDDIYSRDVIIFAEAGDKSNDEKRHPASYSSVISVGAVDEDRKSTSFSQLNNQVELSGPGNLIYSTYRDNSYATMDGTSMATAHVAAVAGLLRLYYPECTNTQIRNVLAKTALDVDLSGCDDKTGFGLVQAKNAYELLEEGECGGDIGERSAIGGCSQIFNCEYDSDCNDDDPCTNDICMIGYCQQEISCESCGLVSVQFDVNTNKYPSETTWDIIDTSNKRRMMSGGPYDKSSTNYSSTKCLDVGNYALTIYDSFGDGLVCQNVENSGYSLFLDNKRHTTGRSFKSEEKVEFQILNAHNSE